jgi:hypothetical protein
MSLHLANIEDAFNDYQAHTDETNINTGLQAEKGYIRTDTQDNKKSSYLQTKNYRTTQYTKNPQYLFKKDQYYDLQGIHDGKGPGRNVIVDDKLTRGNMVPKPNDRLSEHVTFIRRVDFLPLKDRTMHHDKFLVNTSLSVKPQTKFCPQFDIYGINCRHYNRKVDLYFKNKYQRN